MIGLGVVLLKNEDSVEKQITHVSVGLNRMQQHYSDSMEVMCQFSPSKLSNLDLSIQITALPVPQVVGSHEAV